MINAIASLFGFPRHLSEPALPAPIVWHCLHTWKFPDESTVKLLYSNAQKLKYAYTKNGFTKEGAIECPNNGTSIAECIEHLKCLRPNVLPDCSVEFVATISEAPSQFDPNVQVNDDQWAITLADIGTRVITNPLTWNGHACLVVEGTVNGYYFNTLVHLVMSKNGVLIDGHKMGTVVLKINTTCNRKKIPQLFPYEVYHNSVTWVRKRTVVQKMLQKVAYTISEQNQGRPQIPMNLRGQGSVFVNDMVRVRALDPATNGITTHIAHPHNCFTYLREIIKIAEIFLWNPKKFLNLQIAATPCDFIGARTKFPTSCEKVKVRCSLFKGLVHVDLDITCELHHNRSLWQVLKDDKPILVENIQFLPIAVEVPKTIIQMRASGENFKKDITDIVKYKFENEWGTFKAVVKAIKACKMPRNDVPILVKTFPQVTGNTKSVLDPEIVIDPDNWAVTLVSLTSSTPNTIIIEGIDNGRYFVQEIGFDTSNKIGCKDLTDFYPSKIWSKWLTLMISKSEVQKMLHSVQNDISKQVSETILRDDDKWVHEKLSEAGISLIDIVRFVDIIENPLKPCDFIVSNQVYKCQRTQIRCIFAKGLFEQTLDITATLLDQLLREKWPEKWQTMTWEELDLSGHPQRIAAIVDIPLFVGNNFFQVPQVILPIKLQGKGIVNLDITEVIRRNLSVGDVMTQLFGTHIWDKNCFNYYAMTIFHDNVKRKDA